MILIADDFESEIILLKSVLADLGFEDLVVAYDGAEAIKALNSGVEFKAVITDYNMPYNTGADVIKKALNCGISKILLRSSHSVVTLNTKLQEAGVDPNTVQIICKQDCDASELRVYLKEFLS